MSTLLRVLDFFGLPNALALRMAPGEVVYADYSLPIQIRNQSRTILGDLFRELQFHRGAEVGVWHGEFAEVLCKANPALHITLVDAWRPYDGYKDYQRDSSFREAFQDCVERMKPYAPTYLRMFSREAASQVGNGTLDFVYLDANHSLPSFIEDLNAWLPKIRSGGIIAGHDYDRARRKNGEGSSRVAEGVHAWTTAYDIAPWFVIGRRKIRTGEIRDPERSFFWVVP